MDERGCHIAFGVLPGAVLTFVPTCVLFGFLVVEAADYSATRPVWSWAAIAISGVAILYSLVDVSINIWAGSLVFIFSRKNRSPIHFLMLLLGCIADFLFLIAFAVLAFYANQPIFGFSPSNDNDCQTFGSDNTGYPGFTYDQSIQLCDAASISGVLIAVW
jgi:hypothetical protein